MSYVKKVIKCILKGILILFFILLLLLVLFEIIGWVYRYNSRTEGLQYTYDLIKSEELIDMDYSYCCDFLKTAEDNFSDFRFDGEYEISNGFEINGKSSSYYRFYVAGYAISGDGHTYPNIFRVYFGKDDKVVGVEIYEQRGW